MKIPRILLAAGASGSGKTLITCGLLQALINRGKKVASFKCGPDYIDPMFHSKVIGTSSANLDTFFTSDEVTRYLLAANAQDSEIAVMEGVMGYYDGVGGTTTKASAFDLASVTDTPAILIVNSKGMSVSLAAYLKGFLQYKEDSKIRAVIFNRMSAMLYPRMKKLVEEECKIRVLGYVPQVDDCVLESRHLGLVLPEEIPQLKEQLQKLAQVLENTLDLDGILQLAQEASQLEVPEYKVPLVCTSQKMRIGVAKDEAFCFFYKDNFRMLTQMGAELVPFSPLHDAQLPAGLDGILLYGGYPELYAAQLEQNCTMRLSIQEVLRSKMPCMAECGGFMYLHEQMEDMDGKTHAMVGMIPGLAYRTPKLSRFGYIMLEQNVRSENEDELGPIPAHEFHYFDSTNCGTAFHAAKPEGKRSWECMHEDGRMMAGFPHLHYYSNPNVPEQFLKRALAYHTEKIQREESTCTM